MGEHAVEALLAIEPSLEAPVNTSDELRKPYVFWAHASGLQHLFKLAR